MGRSTGVFTFRADRLKAERKRLGLSREELGIVAGISPETVRRAEAGAGRRPSARVVRQLADALGVSVDQLAPPPSTPATLRRLREQKGRTQRQIADMIAVSVQTVSRVERGIYRAGEPERWAPAYGVTRRQWEEAWQAGRDERSRTIRGGTGGT